MRLLLSGHATPLSKSHRRCRSHENILRAGMGRRAWPSSFCDRSCPALTLICTHEKFSTAASEEGLMRQNSYQSFIVAARVRYTRSKCLRHRLHALSSACPLLSDIARNHEVGALADKAQTMRRHNVTPHDIGQNSRSISRSVVPVYSLRTAPAFWSAGITPFTRSGSWRL